MRRFSLVETLYMRLRRSGKGTFVLVRMRRGRLRWLRLRILGQSRGRLYLVGMDKTGLCHRVWLKNVVRIEE